MPIFAMYMPEGRAVELKAPEYWQRQNDRFVQCDLDDEGQPCPMGPRSVIIESKYLAAFPKLKEYLDREGNTLRGFDSKMFLILKDCLQLSFLHQSASFFQRKERIEVEKGIDQILNEKSYSSGKLLDTLYIARLAGLKIIEKSALEAFQKRTWTNGKTVRPLRVDDIYPVFDSLKQIDPWPRVNEYKEEEAVNDSYTSDSDPKLDDSVKPEPNKIEKESTTESTSLPAFTFSLDDITPEMLLKSLEKRAARKKQPKEEKKVAVQEIKKEPMPLAVVRPLWFSDVRSQEEFQEHAAARIEMLRIRIKDAQRTASKVSTQVKEQNAPIKGRLLPEPEIKQAKLEKIVPLTVWGRLKALAVFLFFN